MSAKFLMVTLHAFYWLHVQCCDNCGTWSCLCYHKLLSTSSWWCISLWWAIGNKLIVNWHEIRIQWFNLVFISLNEEMDFFSQLPSIFYARRMKRTESTLRQYLYIQIFINTKSNFFFLIFECIPHDKRLKFVILDLFLFFFWEYYFFIDKCWVFQ